MENKIKMVERNRYSLIIKEFNSVEEVEEYKKANEGHSFVAFQGEVVSKTSDVKEEN